MKTIVITGCSTGFGFQAAQVFANRGDKVFATMRDLDGKNSEAAAQLREASPNISVVELDVLSDASVESASAAILEGGVAPDVLINNAGQMYVGIAEAFTADEFSRQLDINVVGIHRVNRGLLPAMRSAGKGLIINVSSVAGRFGAPFFSIYHASKWAVEGYSLGMRRELASSGVDVVVVEPGPFSTELFGQSPKPKDADGRAETYPEIVPETFEAMGKAFEGMFMDPNVPTDPIGVVNTFVSLADSEAGTRPFRSVVGVDIGVRARNESDELHEGPFLEAMGLTDFARLKS